jgi:hypothetical protein
MVHDKLNIRGRAVGLGMEASRESLPEESLASPNARHRAWETIKPSIESV